MKKGDLDLDVDGKEGRVDGDADGDDHVQGRSRGGLDVAPVDVDASMVKKEKETVLVSFEDSVVEH